jgi:hypothetical protein
VQAGPTSALMPVGLQITLPLAGLTKYGTL